MTSNTEAPEAQPCEACEAKGPGMRCRDHRVLYRPLGLGNRDWARLKAAERARREA